MLTPANWLMVAMQDTLAMMPEQPGAVGRRGQILIAVLLTIYCGVAIMARAVAEYRRPRD